ncbi:hypothetical protein [Microbacterium sp. dk485]|uniref:hypothetical protein n=1 Tax=Microbacterium sp. dk485 TaxID=2560021 RepID=UPI001FD86DF0|nr:hypothetical protein [Microbacterium sp. dk485]
MENPRQLPSEKWQGRVTGPDGKHYSAGVHTSLRKAPQAQAMRLAELEALAEEDYDPKSQTRFDNYAKQHLWSRRPGEITGYAPTSYYERQHALHGEGINRRALRRPRAERRQAQPPRV